MPETYTDKALNCVECSADFTFTAGEQEHHARLGFQNLDVSIRKREFFTEFD